MDFCCGTTMTARIEPLYTEEGALLTDVPFLYCHTCGNMRIAPEVELDVTMYLHYCNGDQIRSASLHDVVDREHIQGILDKYPPHLPLDTPYVTDEQVDHMLDVWNLASELGDHEWMADVKKTLMLFYKVRCEQLTVLQKQP